MRRWLLRLGIGAVVLIVVLIVGAKLLLRSGFAADKVAAQLQEAAGGAPVHVGSLDVGVTGSTLHDLQFLEESSPPGLPPWASIATVDADLSLPQLLRGDLAGGVVKLHRPKLSFRLDKDNNLLTKLPSFGGPSRPWPEFQIVGGEVAFLREGQPDTVFSNIKGTLRKTGDHIALEAAANDSDWGKWKLTGDRPTADAPFKLTLHSDDVRVTPEMLRQVPFVPPVTWEQVTLDGETPVDVVVQFGGSKGGPSVRYRVALAPRDTTVTVPSIGLTTKDTKGKAVIEDGVVTLTNVDGKTAGGSLYVARSVMDFRGDESVLKFKISADRLVLQDLPRKWGVPVLDGRMSGRADLTLTIHNGQVKTSGGGTGTIEGFLTQNVQVKMVANERGYRFDITNALGASLGPNGLAPEGRKIVAHDVSRGLTTHEAIGAWGGSAAPRADAVIGDGYPRLTPWATVFRPSGAKSSADAATDLNDALSTVLAQLLATGMVTLEPIPPVADTPGSPSDAGQSIRINLGLQNVSLAELVHKLDVKLPIQIDGKLTFNVHASIPMSNSRDIKAYHATGTVEMPWVRIENLWLQQVRAQIVFEKGVLRLDELSAHEPNTPPSAPPTQLLPGGTVLGTASLGVSPAGDLSAKLKVTALPIGPILKVIPNGDANSAGTVDGEANFRAPAGAIKDIRKWEGSAKFEGRNARLKNIPTDKFSADLVLHDGAATFKVKGETLGGTFDLKGRYPDDGKQGRLNVRRIDLSRLADALRIDALKPLGGRLVLDATYGFGNGEPSGSGQLILAGLTWGGKPLTDRLGGTIQVTDGLIRIDEFGGQLAGGTVRGRVRYDYQHPERSNAMLTAQRVDARTLLAPFTYTPPLDGPLDARLYTRFGREWDGSGQIVLANGKLFGITVRDAQFPLGWVISPGRRGELRLNDAAAQASRGRLTGRATLDWGDTARLEGQARFSSIDVGEMLSHYSNSHVLGGLASGRVDFGGREMRSARDISARVDAKLAQAQPSQMPVFRQVMPMILPGVGANVQFQSGELRGTLAGGVFRIQRLTLVGDLARIYAEGSVSLQERLDLNVVANTSQLGIDPAMLQLLGIALPAVGPIPLAAMNQAINYLSNRTISLRVTGTVKAPSIRFNPVPFLTETVVRFFISQAGVPIPSAVLQGAAP